MFDNCVVSETPQPHYDKERRPNQFAERTPYSELDAALIQLQIQTDDVGKIVYGQSQRNPRAVKDYDMPAHAAVGLALLQESQLGVALTRPHTIHARYFYDANQMKTKLTYPADLDKTHAIIEGKITGVKPELVYHPHPYRKGVRGYRICAQIEATNIMGWQASAERAKILVPIGELYTEHLSPEQYAADALYPITKWS